MKKLKHKLLIFLFLLSVSCLYSCSGTRVVHGKDCGCGSFSQAEQNQAKQAPSDFRQ